jgi:hypothetical protein
MVGDRVIQPIANGRTVKDGPIPLLDRDWVITLTFEFDVSPEDLNKVRVIVTDGAGRKRQSKTSLTGILNANYDPNQ